MVITYSFKKKIKHPTYKILEKLILWKKIGIMEFLLIKLIPGT